MKAALDKGQFGPWALVTGASSLLAHSQDPARANPLRNSTRMEFL
jgi:hypothetical protein